MTTDAHVVVRTAAFDDDLAALTGSLGFRVDAIYPADAPDTAIVSAHGVRLRLERATRSSPIELHLVTDGRPAGEAVTLPGGSTLEVRPRTTSYHLPENVPTIAVAHDDGSSAPGRAGMRYRDLIDDRWGGRFVASHITIPDGGPVPDYVHFHKVRFQVIVVQAGWVRLVYEDQGDPFVMHAGDCVLQPPEIRHRVLEASPGLEVVEIGCPALHETIADHALELPNATGSPDRTWSGQRFVRHVAADATFTPWRHDGWKARDSGIGVATGGLAGIRFARPLAGATDGDLAAFDTEFAFLYAIEGAVTIEFEGGEQVRLPRGSSVAIPGGLAHRLVDPAWNTELLDVTLPASPSRR